MLLMRSPERDSSKFYGAQKAPFLISVLIYARFRQADLLSTHNLCTVNQVNASTAQS